MSRIQLEWIKNIPLASAVDGPATSPSQRSLIWGAIGVATVLAIGSCRFDDAQRPRRSPLTRSLSTVARVTHEAGFSEWPTWSPDGSLFAFTSNRDGNFDLYVRPGRGRPGGRQRHEQRRR